MRVKKVKRLIFPGLRSQLPHSRESARTREREREREGKRERASERKKKERDTGTKALMEQRCFNQHGMCVYTVLQGSYSQQR